MVRHTRPGGLGDQLFALLGSIALAVITGRRLEVAPQLISYVHVGFRLVFDADYTAEASWLRSSVLRARRWGKHALDFDHCLEMDQTDTPTEKVKQASYLIHRRISADGHFAATSTHCQRDIAKRMVSDTTWSDSNITEFFAAGMCVHSQVAAAAKLQRLRWSQATPG